MEKRYGPRYSVEDYVFDLLQLEDPILRKVRELSESQGVPPIQISPYDVCHLDVLARSCQARKIVEIGTLGGYSGVAFARTLPPGGKLHTFELDPRNARVAQQAFELAGVQDRVQIHIGPALDGLSQIESEAPFDIVFIDADKGNYPGYLKWATRHLRLGGLVIADNVFGFGMIGKRTGLSPTEKNDVEGIEKFNHELAQGGNFSTTLLPTDQGLAVGVRIK